jgi:hypothetical protein
MTLNPKQHALLLSLSYRDIMAKAKISQSTVKRLRSNIADMKLGTLENILKRVWGMSVKEFMQLS